MNLGTNFSFSVVKREERDYEDVESHLQRSGWEKTGSFRNLHYFQKDGFNITAFDGPRGTVMFPSGPIRGRIFSEGVGFGLFTERSGIGMGTKTENRETAKPGDEDVVDMRV